MGKHQTSGRRTKNDRFLTPARPHRSMNEGLENGNKLQRKKLVYPEERS